MLKDDFEKNLNLTAEQILAMDPDSIMNDDETYEKNRASKEKPKVELSEREKTIKELFKMSKEEYHDHFHKLKSNLDDN